MKVWNAYFEELARTHEAEKDRNALAINNIQYLYQQESLELQNTIKKMFVEGMNRTKNNKKMLNKNNLMSCKGILC